jgi:DNA ligase 1
VAIDRTTGKLMPFQELSKRKRKDVKVEDIQIRVCLFAFDLLYLNGEVSVLATCCFSPGLFG